MQASGWVIRVTAEDGVVGHEASGGRVRHAAAERQEAKYSAEGDKDAHLLRCMKGGAGSDRMGVHGGRSESRGRGAVQSTVVTAGERQHTGVRAQKGGRMEKH